MSFTQPGGEDVRASGLSLNLSSNNPFRNRTTSPAQLSPRDPPPRPLSRNPFLDDAGTVKENIRPQQTMPSPTRARPQRPVLTGNAAELFDELTLEDKSRTTRPAPSSRTLTDPSRQENIPPRGPPTTHRPTRSQEQAMRQRRPPGSSKPRPPTDELDIFADSAAPRESTERRRRRNSDSSLMERKPLNPEEEKKRQERRRQERKQREGDASKDSKVKKPSRKLDIIDQLDATSIYGTGLFHHDGPFDACNPHRNRKGSRRAPMQAFPKDSLNNALGGGGPLNKRPDHATFLGNNDNEAFKDYSRSGAGSAAYESYGTRPTAARNQASVQSSLEKVEPVHGDESLGLGTSTFLEGAPASKAAIQRNAVESATAEVTGLTRKKSLAQKIRGISNNKRDFGPGPPGRIVGAEPRYGATSPQYAPGGSTNRAKASDNNPFFNEFESNGDKKETLTFVEPETKPARARAPSSPSGTTGERLERRVTTGSTGNEEAPKQNTGFLSRVKSLKGGPRRPKAEKPVYD